MYKAVLCLVVILTCLCNNVCPHPIIIDDVNAEMLEFVALAINFTLEQEAILAMSGIGGGLPNDTFHTLQFLLGQTSYAHGLSLSAAMQIEALNMLKDKYAIPKAEMEAIIGKMNPILNPHPASLREDMDLAIPAIHVCPFPIDSDCNKYRKYRPMDGACTNTAHATWGRAMTPLKRVIPADYGDGISSPRRAKSGNALPSAREVSRRVFPATDSRSPVHSLFIMTFGQIVDHDLSRTALTKILDASGAIVDVNCGSDGCNTQGLENRACLPIEINHIDDVTFQIKPCLPFTHTQPVINVQCKPGPKDQLNQITSYIDASNVYGSSVKDSLSLRDPDPARGRMAMIPHPFLPDVKHLLTSSHEAGCRAPGGDISCFRAGDARVNEQVALTALHTVFSRYHNHLEKRLHAINPNWDGETLYQEARKIVGAAMQVIIYKEFLPLILGKRYMEKYRLVLKKKHFCDEYSPHVDSSISNGFATAAYRFGHTLITSELPMYSPDCDNITTVPLTQVFENPYLIYSTNSPARTGVDAIMFGQIAHSAEAFDTHISPMVTQHLFTEQPPVGIGTDLGALNIQRGRDHGIPSYNKYREWCGLKPASDFDDLRDIPDQSVRDNFSQLYEHVDDIDIFAAGLAEASVPGGMVGPTFACMIGQQFQDLRHGDRYWHENNHRNHSFWGGQIIEIRKITMARIICHTLDEVHKIQPNVFLKPMSEFLADGSGRTRQDAQKMAQFYLDNDNERCGCVNIPDIDLSHWYDWDQETQNQESHV